MNNEYTTLRVDKLIQTADRLASRINTRFPEASLSKLAYSVADVIRDAVSRAETIQRPDWLVRGGLLTLAGVVLLLGVGGVVIGWRDSDPQTFLQRLLEVFRMTQGALVFLSAVVVFLWTLETRLKRGRAVKAIHELRALAHIIDMHQLARDPEGDPGEGIQYTHEGTRHYLRYCTELLALVSKIGQLYVQDFPDSTTLSAVDHFEGLANGLSRKIWQKLMILDENEDSVVEKPTTA